jgi:hypothetical protein
MSDGPRTRGRRAVLPVGAALVALSMWTPAQAAERPPACGDVVTTSVTLTSDLVCPGDGLTIGRAGVTLDLGGHTVRHPSAGSPAGTGLRIAPSGDDAASGITVRNGSVVGFGDAVVVRTAREGKSSPPVAMADLGLSGNDWALASAGTGDVAIDRVVVDGSNGLRTEYTRIHLYRSSIRTTGAAVRGSFGTELSIEGSAVTGGDVYVLGTRLSLDHSVFRGVPFRCGDSVFHFDRSWLSGSPIRFGQCNPSSITDSVLESVTSGPAVYVDNFIDTDPAGPPALTLTGNVIAANQTGLHLEGLVDSAEVTGNVFSGNGIGMVATPYPGAASAMQGAVRRNAFIGNRTDGLRLAGGTWKVGRNLAVANGGAGIVATGEELTLTDEGGNVAIGNGGAPCIGIACRP